MLSPRDLGLALVSLSIALASETRRRLIQIIPAALAIAALMAVGPWLQFYVLSIANSTSSNLYQTAFNNSINPDYTFAEWLVPNLFVYLVPATLCAFLVTREKSVRRAIVTLAGAAFPSLLVVDLISLPFLVEGERPTGPLQLVDYLLVNTATNFAGAVLIALVLLGLYSLARSISLTLLRPNAVALTRLIVVLLVGLTTTSAYYLCRAIYAPTPAQMDAYLARPQSGWYAPNEGTSGDSDFSFLPTNLQGHTLGWLAPSSEMKLSWEANNQARTYDLAVSFRGGCPASRVQFDDVTDASTLVARNVRTLVVKMDKGYAQFASRPALETTLKDEFTAPRGYTIEQSPEEGYSTTELADPEGGISLLSEGPPAPFGMNVALYRETDADSTKLISSSRSVSVTINGTQYLINVVPSPSRVEKETSSCMPLSTPSKDLFSGIPLPLEKGSENFELLFALAETSTSRQVEGAPDNTLEITGGTGWLTSTGKDDPSEFSPQSNLVDFIVFGGNVIQLTMDGEKVELLPVDSVQAVGDLSVEYVDEGKVRVQGMAKLAWKNNVRLLRTRMEKLPWEVGLLTITAAGSLALLFARYLLSLVKGRRTTVW
jgi:hypothetical protein